MTLQLTPSTVINMASGVLFIALALYVASLRPRRAGNVAFAMFGFGMGMRTVLTYAGLSFSPDDPGFLLAGAASVFDALAVVSLVLVALRFPRPLAAGERRLLVLPAFAALAVVGTFALAVTADPASFTSTTLLAFPALSG